MKKTPLIIISCLLLVFLIGCGRSGPPVQYVEGVVIFDDKPLDKAQIAFIPKDENVGLPATGLTDEKGVFKLTALQGGAPNGGTLIGEYSVAISRNQDEPSGVRQMSGPMGSHSIKIYDSLIPERYKSPQTSGVSATVKKGKNRFEFVLEKK